MAWCARRSYAACPGRDGAEAVPDRHLPASVAILASAAMSWIWRGVNNFLATARSSTSRAPDAYAFLLRFACGLESKLVAETEIFGQIKQAWRDFSEPRLALARQLSPWIQQLFQDAKEIRAQYLVQPRQCLLWLAGAPAARRGARLRPDAAGRRRPARPGRGALAHGLGAVALEPHPRARVKLALELAKRSPERPVRVIEGGARLSWRPGAHRIRS
jgi:hypothetical protein